MGYIIEKKNSASWRAAFIILVIIKGIDLLFEMS